MVAESVLDSCKCGYDLLYPEIGYGLRLRLFVFVVAIYHACSGYSAHVDVLVARPSASFYLLQLFEGLFTNPQHTKELCTTHGKSVVLSR